MLEVLTVVAIVVYVIGRQMLGEALRGKRVVLLPVVLAVVGLTRLHGHGTAVRPADMVLLVVGGVVAAAVGAALGVVMRLEERDGALWGRMPAWGLLLWAALISSRLVLMLLGHVTGAHVAASTAPIVLMLGINRLGQAAVIVLRAHAMGVPFAAEKDGSDFLGGRLQGLGARFGGTGAGPLTRTRRGDRRAR